MPGWTGAPVGGGDRATSHVCHGWKYHSSEMGPHPQGTITPNSYSIYSCTLLVYYLYTTCILFYTTCMLFVYYLYTTCMYTTCILLYTTQYIGNIHQYIYILCLNFCILDLVPIVFMPLKFPHTASCRWNVQGGTGGV